MSRRYLSGATALVCAASVLACVLFGLRGTTCPAADGKEAPAKGVFGATKSVQRKGAVGDDHGSARVEFFGLFKILYGLGMTTEGGE